MSTKTSNKTGQSGKAAKGQSVSSTSVPTNGQSDAVTSVPKNGKSDALTSVPKNGQSDALTSVPPRGQSYAATSVLLSGHSTSFLLCHPLMSKFLDREENPLVCFRLTSPDIVHMPLMCQSTPRSSSFGPASLFKSG